MKSLGFRPSDYILKPFKAYFFHVNPRHHSLAFIDTGKNGIHHLMMETCFLDDVGQAYDLALGKPEMIGTTLGRHVNDYMTSFYSWSPSNFLVEYGWGGRSIDPGTWTPHERTEGPSLWGHDRSWLTPEGRAEARLRFQRLLRVDEPVLRDLAQGLDVVGGLIGEAGVCALLLEGLDVGGGRLAGLLDEKGHVARQLLDVREGQRRRRAWRALRRLLRRLRHGRFLSEALGPVQVSTLQGPGPLFVILTL